MSSAPTRRATRASACPALGDECAVAREVAASALAPWFEGRATGTLWVAFSGGVDSTALLHVLRRRPNVAAIHIDHGLHAESATWAQRCAATAAAWGVPLRIRAVAVAPGGNLEAKARRARYAVWRDLLQPGDVLALAHHANDQAETRLWQLLTGREAGGMPTERTLGDGLLLRPMLRLPKSAIVHYAKRRKLTWVEDPANADLRSDRNFIRRHVVPRIECRSPSAFARLAAPRPRPAHTLPPLSAANCTEARVAAWLAAAALPLARGPLREIARQSAASPSRLPRIAVAPGIDAWRYRQHWHLVRRLDESRVPRPANECVVGIRANLPGGVLSWQSGAFGLAVGTPLAARHRDGGERLRLRRRGGRKTVKALFQEHGVAPWRRSSWPLLCDRDGELVALPGIGVAAHRATSDGLEPRWTPSPDTLTSG